MQFSIYMKTAYNCENINFYETFIFVFILLTEGLVQQSPNSYLCLFRCKSSSSSDDVTQRIVISSRDLTKIVTWWMEMQDGSKIYYYQHDKIWLSKTIVVNFLLSVESSFSHSKENAHIFFSSFIAVFKKHIFHR